LRMKQNFKYKQKQNQILIDNNHKHIQYS